MKLCKGCKHLRGVHCYQGGRMLEFTPPFRGTTVTKWYSPHTNSTWPPNIENMRKVTGPCGPERKLYQPSLWTRIKRFFHANT